MAMPADRPAAVVRVSYRLIDRLATSAAFASTVGLFFVIGAWSLFVLGGYLLGGVSFYAFERKPDDRWW